MSPYPFIVAEMGANHGQDLQRALDFVDVAKQAGADALKLQTYTPECMVVKGACGPAAGPWAGEDLWDLYERAALPWSWHEQIFRRCDEVGLICFSSPFSVEAVDFLERLGCPMYKIASFEILDLELIKRCAMTKKPLVISTGMATLEEIKMAVRIARFCLCEDLTLLKGTSAYPAPAAEANISTLFGLRARFECNVGLSDHTVGCGVAVAAALAGADMIEKHLTSSWRGLDSSFSAGPADFASMVRAIRDAIDADGHVQFGPTPAEAPMLALRRSLRAIRDIKAGEVFTTENLKAMRPAGGLHPADLHRLLGRQATRDIHKGEPVAWDMLHGAAGVGFDIGST